VKTANASATGSFISSTGLLLTNNHVLGVPVCPSEGCSIQISEMHQRGSAPLQAQNVFAVPVVVDEGLDMAVVQLYTSLRDASGAKLDSPDYLSWNVQSSAALIGTHVTIVGHPEGALKKWTDGVVTDAFGTWFSSSAYILPGNSGSPVLDEQGRIVGLIHHASVAQDMVTSDSVDEVSDGTASAPLYAALTAPLPSTMISVNAMATSAFVVQNHLTYLNGNATAVVVSDQPGATMPVPVLSLLGSACDAALADMSVETIDQLSPALQTRKAADRWIQLSVVITPSFVHT
jgi:hypothetical protein